MDGFAPLAVNLNFLRMIDRASEVLRIFTLVWTGTIGVRESDE